MTHPAVVVIGRNPSDCVFSLPDEFRTQLADSWIARGGHLPELVAVDISGGIEELRTIENVEELGTDLNRH